ncbi:MAG: hypothetical protein RR528_07310, partial [Angelakisella sp.]
MQKSFFAPEYIALSPFFFVFHAVSIICAPYCYIGSKHKVHFVGYTQPKLSGNHLVGGLMRELYDFLVLLLIPFFKKRVVKCKLSLQRAQIPVPTALQPELLQW